MVLAHMFLRFNMNNVVGLMRLVLNTNTDLLYLTHLGMYPGILIKHNPVAHLCYYVRVLPKTITNPTMPSS